jgi:hypothetical protein
VNPRERLHAPDNSDYHENQVERLMRFIKMMNCRVYLI